MEGTGPQHAVRAYGAVADIKFFLFLVCGPRGGLPAVGSNLYPGPWSRSIEGSQPAADPEASDVLVLSVWFSVDKLSRERDENFIAYQIRTVLADSC